VRAPRKRHQPRRENPTHNTGLAARTANWGQAKGRINANGTFRDAAPPPTLEPVGGGRASAAGAARRPGPGRPGARAPPRPPRAGAVFQAGGCLEVPERRGARERQRREPRGHERGELEGWVGARGRPPPPVGQRRGGRGPAAKLPLPLACRLTAEGRASRRGEARARRQAAASRRGCAGPRGANGPGPGRGARRGGRPESGRRARAYWARRASAGPNKALQATHVSSAKLKQPKGT
jgi:hypothetical protein